MSEVDDSLVKTGFWINWSHGPVMGRTITTNATMANVVIALLTVLITVATAQLWNLITFVLHQIRATGIPSDGLFWQQQALLRTLPPPTSLVADSLKLWWAWRKKSERPLLRSLLPSLLAFLFAIGAVASGIFSTWAVDVSNIEVLVESPYCGRVNISRTYDPGSGASTHFANLFPVMKEYARDCYQERAFLPSRCHNTFIKPNISFTQDPADCPWDASMCLSDKSPALSMDSGLLDQSHFGFNVEPHNGVKLRKKTVCNILPLPGHFTISNATNFTSILKREPLPNEEIMSLHYFYENRTSDQSRATFVKSLASSNVSEVYNTFSRVLYMEARDPTRLDVDLPLTEMNRTDADVALNVLWLNNVQYSKPVDDPLFSAHNPREYTSGGVNFTSYQADTPGAVIGCTNQFQFCIARKAKDDLCTPLQGLPSVVDKNTWPEANDLQLVMLQLIRDANLEMDVTTAPLYDYTQAGELIQKGEIPRLPDDQWKIETIGWEALAYTGIQIRLSDYAIGPKVRDPAADVYMEAPTTPAEKELCGSMKMRKSGGFANINVFGLTFIITFSFLMSIFNILLLRFMIFLSRFRRALAPRLDRWVQDGVFQLQRRAFDSYNQGTWSHINQEIPVTMDGQFLAELPVESRVVEPKGFKLSPASSFGTQIEKEYLAMGKADFSPPRTPRTVASRGSEKDDVRSLPPSPLRRVSTDSTMVQYISQEELDKRKARGDR